MATQPNLADRVVKVRAYLTDETLGYEHWRAAQFSAPKHDKFGVLLLFDSEAERNLAAQRKEGGAMMDAAERIHSTDAPAPDARVQEIRRRMTEIEAACDSCCPDDPPWNDILEGFGFVDELLAQLEARTVELETAVARYQGWQDFFSGQPRDFPYPARLSQSIAKESQLNFAWAVGYDSASESEVFRQMVARADKAEGLAHELEARTQERDKWFIECERLGIGLVEASEDLVDAPEGEVLPERAVDAAFGVINELTEQWERLKENGRFNWKQRAGRAEAALRTLRAQVQQLPEVER